MKAYWRSGSTAPHILNLCCRWMWVVTFTHRQLYSRGRTTSTHFI